MNTEILIFTLILFGIIVWLALRDQRNKLDEAHRLKINELWQAQNGHVETLTDSDAKIYRTLTDFRQRIEAIEARREYKRIGDDPENPPTSANPFHNREDRYAREMFKEKVAVNGVTQDVEGK